MARIRFAKKLHGVFGRWILFRLRKFVKINVQQKLMKGNECLVGPRVKHCQLNRQKAQRGFGQDIREGIEEYRSSR